MQLLQDQLLLAIAAPLALALAIGLGLPKRWSVRLAYVAFAIPALLAICVWWNFAAAPKQDGYAFLTQYSTGLTHLGISLKLGLNGISLPMFVLAGLVGLAAGLYAIQSNMPSSWIMVRPAWEPGTPPDACPDAYPEALVKIDFEGETGWIDPGCAQCAPFEIRPELLGADALGFGVTETPPPAGASAENHG